MECPECKSTENHKFGIIITRKGLKQRYRCKRCGRTFYKT